MSDINWQEGAVCFIDGEQYPASVSECIDIYYLLEGRGFQLNTIKQGDYIEALELDTEQKYNDVAGVFELFGFELASSIKAIAMYDFFFISSDGCAGACSKRYLSSINSRKLTYPQLMAIGKLKRAMIELDEDSPTKICEDWREPQKEAKELDPEWTDKHYNNFYQLTEEDVKSGQIKIDAYFVNRMWKINSWDDTGAGFHVLKTLPRIANNKNPLKRELKALKKQVDLLCKMHGVDNENTK